MARKGKNRPAKDKPTTGSPLKRMQDWIIQYGPNMLNDPDNGVMAVAVGRKHAGPLSNESAPLSITAFVEEKLSKRQLRKVGD